MGVINITKSNVKLKISFINPNSKEKFEELLKLVAVEKLKSKNKTEAYLSCQTISYPKE